MPDLNGQSIGRYASLEKLDEGGMAVVYKAYDTRLETEVALKVIRTESLPQKLVPQALARFEREARSLARLTHPNIVSVIDYGKTKGSPYLVMKYMPGGSLSRRLGRPIPWQESLRLLVPIAEALDYAHEEQILHRDVKPANILLTGKGQPMLSDFGIAKILDLEEGQTLTATGMGIGTPEYMSPEQGLGRQVDARTDVYSLGVVFYEMLTGQKPFTADTPMAVLDKHLHAPLPDPTQFVKDLPQAVVNALYKSLAKQPEGRYASMGEFCKVLEGLLTAQVAAPRKESRPFLRRPKARTSGFLPALAARPGENSPKNTGQADVWNPSAPGGVPAAGPMARPENRSSFPSEPAGETLAARIPPAPPSFPGTKVKRSWVPWIAGTGGILLLAVIAFLLSKIPNPASLLPFADTATWTVSPAPTQAQLTPVPTQAPPTALPTVAPLTPLPAETPVIILTQGIISAGDYHTCALTQAGGVKCWGRDDGGQLGDGNTTDRLIPVVVSGLWSGVSAISAVADHTCALTQSGGVKCWGFNLNGQLGDGTTTDRLMPVEVSGLGSGVRAVSAGALHTCALTQASGVKCWGNNYDGQLGDGTTTDRLTPMEVSGLGSGVSAISAGFTQTCALMQAGGVKCWGGNEYGTLGDRTTIDRLTPVDVNGLRSGVSAISAGYYHTCALTQAGGVKCWGPNDYGQLGDGTTVKRLKPVDVNGLESGVSAISAGYFHTCARMQAGGVKCWGQNNYGKLGDGTTNIRFTPVFVRGLESGVSAISAGESHTCALMQAGGVKCWGGNQYGQLGDGTTEDQYTPVDVIGFP